MCCSVLYCYSCSVLHCVAVCMKGVVCCIVLYRVVVSCNVLHVVSVCCCSVLQCFAALYESKETCVNERRGVQIKRNVYDSKQTYKRYLLTIVCRSCECRCFSVLQYVAVCCSMLQYVAVCCCSVL